MRSRRVSCIAFSFGLSFYLYSVIKKARGPCKTPKSLKNVLPMLDKLLWYHGKCTYKLLRNKVCPSKERVTALLTAMATLASVFTGSLLRR
jgi:hypothetical protein